MARSQWSHLYNDRRWRRLRAIQLQQHPLCARCEAQGKLTPATICDHIESHHGDLGKFWTGPFQSLCKYHHDVKTIMEDAGLNAGKHTHPEWLPKPACPVVVVTGPPGAGKSTWCNEQAKRADVVIDLDECIREVSGIHGHEAGTQWLGAGIRLRNKLLANLATKRIGMAYLIVSAPTEAERKWWADKLGATEHRLDPGIDACLSRVGTARRSAVRSWYAKAAENKWTPAIRAMGSDADGTPMDPAHHWN